MALRRACGGPPEGRAAQLVIGDGPDFFCGAPGLNHSCGPHLIDPSTPLCTVGVYVGVCTVGVYVGVARTVGVYVGVARTVGVCCPGLRSVAAAAVDDAIGAVGRTPRTAAELELAARGGVTPLGRPRWGPEDARRSRSNGAWPRNVGGMTPV
jgi:hypothetical protein